MKHTIFLLFIFLSSSLFSQSFYKSKYFEIGYKDTITKEIFWSDKEPMEPTLIALGSRKITIHSEKLQQYFLQGEKKEIEDFVGFSCEAINLEGKNFVVNFYEEIDKSYFLVIEDNKNILKMYLFFIE
jgi:hypothetical protein